VNDATRLFGGTLGVAVIGSVAASLYASRLSATLPARLPQAAISAAQGSVGGAVIASHRLAQLGQGVAAHDLADAATQAFLHSLSGGCLVAAGVAVAGALVAALLLPARPRRQDEIAGQGPGGPPAEVAAAAAPTADSTAVTPGA
jgi:hypothetical protein